MPNRSKHEGEAFLSELAPPNSIKSCRVKIRIESHDDNAASQSNC
jgi:hypothetical protein